MIVYELSNITMSTSPFVFLTSWYSEFMPGFIYIIGEHLGSVVELVIKLII